MSGMKFCPSMQLLIRLDIVLRLSFFMNTTIDVTALYPMTHLITKRVTFSSV